MPSAWSKLEAGDGAAALAALTVSVGAVFATYLLARGGASYSRPGDARPPSRRMRKPRFRAAAARVVESGWQPCVDVAHAKPGGEALPTKVAGQQVWEFKEGTEALEGVLPFEPATNPNNSDSIFRAARLRSWQGPRPDAASQPATPLEAVKKGFKFYQMLQCDDGQWAGDYGGPHFLLPGFVIAAYITGPFQEILSRPHRSAMEAYLRNHQQEDGGWGSHIESPSTLFGTVLNYVALRLLGAAADDPACQEARTFMRAHGGALQAPQWAKFWLCCLGVYDWRGLSPITPEMWLLPAWFPIHPGRFWCHCRMVYLPMCYLFGRRFTFSSAATDPVTVALREELYHVGFDYAAAPWEDYLHCCAEIDSYTPVHWTMRTLLSILAVYERIGPWNFLRKRSLDFAEEYLEAENKESNYLTIGPVSKALHQVCAFVAAGGEAEPEAARRSASFRACVARTDAYLWVAEDGMKVQGYNGSMIWDTSFALQAAVEAGLQDEMPEMCGKAWEFLVKQQVLILPKGDWRHWRQPIRGSWGFSTAEQSWPVSDTTGEAFKAVLLLNGDPCTAKRQQIPDEQLFDTVQFLLSYQNADGGWATYETCRGWGWYELLNPSHVFGNIMIDYSYVECSGSAMAALALLAERFPEHRPREIRRAILRGAEFVESLQRADGSWYGCWGCCFTYGCWFGIEALLVAGHDPEKSDPIQRCVAFLLQKQNEDGGWGEDFGSCYDLAYSSSDKLYGCEGGSAVVQSSWALLALLAGRCKDAEAVGRGAKFLMRRQQPDGDWPQESIAGVFNRSIGITYTAFRNVFPLWALARFARGDAPR